MRVTVFYRGNQATMYANGRDTFLAVGVGVAEALAFPQHWQTRTYIETPDINWNQRLKHGGRKADDEISISVKDGLAVHITYKGRSADVYCVPGTTREEVINIAATALRLHADWQDWTADTIGSSRWDDTITENTTIELVNIWY
jgi:hypothetical protein